MLIRFLLDLGLALSLALGASAQHPGARSATDPAPRPASHLTITGPRRISTGPRPPKKPPENRPHDGTWSDIKTQLGGRP